MDESSLVITIKEPEEVKVSEAERINIDPKNVEKGLSKLILTIVELLRKLLEKQAMRRIDGGSLSNEEIERVGLTLMRLENKMRELKKYLASKTKILISI